MYFKTTSPTFSLWSLFEIVTFLFNTVCATLCYDSLAHPLNFSQCSRVSCEMSNKVGGQYLPGGLMPGSDCRLAPASLSFYVLVSIVWDWVTVSKCWSSQLLYIFLSWQSLPMGPRASHCLAFLRHLCLNVSWESRLCSFLCLQGGPYCMQVIHANSDGILRGLPPVTRALKLSSLLSCFQHCACRGEVGGRGKILGIKESVKQSRFQIKK